MTLKHPILHNSRQRTKNEKIPTSLGSKESKGPEKLLTTLLDQSLITPPTPPLRIERIKLPSKLSFGVAIGVVNQQTLFTDLAHQPPFKITAQDLWRSFRSIP
eukprot:TRINITY_DN23600_c2_g1_i2.p1 TRINITY_DN23600_c2_g1~~TRINITY_DN23600_c2_g1_i2.p1  ORF type:complete len:103 (+),score=4.92 TRINITY_DN23600_c2_g1_i2:43-351(+)